MSIDKCRRAYAKSSDVSMDLAELHSNSTIASIMASMDNSMPRSRRDLFNHATLIELSSPNLSTAPSGVSDGGTLVSKMSIRTPRAHLGYFDQGDEASIESGMPVSAQAGSIRAMQTSAQWHESTRKGSDMYIVHAPSSVASVGQKMGSTGRKGYGMERIDVGGAQQPATPQAMSEAVLSPCEWFEKVMCKEAQNITQPSVLSPAEWAMHMMQRGGFGGGKDMYAGPLSQNSLDITTRLGAFRPDMSGQRLY
jgi:hypothetical protein